MQKSLQDIIRKVKAGDSKAFRMLVEENQGRAYRLAWRMLGNEADARDVVQDSFIKMWKKIHSYREDQQFSNWMYAIVSNTAIDRIRARRREDTVSLDDMMHEIRDIAEDDSLEKLENEEAARLIRAFTGHLPEKQRLVFSLRDLHGLSSSDVEDITGMTEDSVKSNLYHARKTLQKKLMDIFMYERKER